MSLRIDTTELITGAYVIGETGLGVLGSAVPSTGEHGASYLYNDLSLPADNDKEIRGLIVTPPSDGTFYAWEDGSFSLIGAADGEYTFTYQLFVDGVDLGSATSTISIGAEEVPEIAPIAASTGGGGTSRTTAFSKSRHDLHKLFDRAFEKKLPPGEILEAILPEAPTSEQVARVRQVVLEEIADAPTKVAKHQATALLAKLTALQEEQDEEEAVVMLLFS